MELESKIAMIRTLGGEEYNEKDDDGNYVITDDVISAYLMLSETAIMNRAFPYGYEDKPFPRKYESKLLEIAIFMCDREGANGETIHNENGVLRHYSTGYIPEGMLADIIPHCGVL